MTIDVGYAHLALPDGTELDFVDVPGHDRLVGNMLVGAGEIDAALLVVAADDGPRAQTLEHLALLDALAIRHGRRGGDQGRRGRCRPDGRRSWRRPRRLLEGTSLAGSPVLAVSAIGRGRDRCAAGRPCRASRSRRASRDGRMQRRRVRASPIDRVFAVKGRGVVVTGTLRGRALASGTTLRLVPGDRSVRVREVQVHGTTVSRGRSRPDRPQPRRRRRGRPASRPRPDRRPSASRRATGSSSGSPGRSRIGRAPGSTSGPRRSTASVGRSGRDALDLPDGAPAAILRLATPIAVAAGRPARAAADRWRRAHRRARSSLDADPAAGSRGAARPPTRVGRLADAIAAGDGPAAAAARLDLHGVVDRSPASSDPSTAVAPDLLATVGVVGAGGRRAGRRRRSPHRRPRDRGPGPPARRDDRPDRRRAGRSGRRRPARPDGRLERDGAVVRPPGTAPRAAGPGPGPGRGDGPPRARARDRGPARPGRCRPRRRLSAGRGPRARAERPDRRPRAGPRLRDDDLPRPHRHGRRDGPRPRRSRPAALRDATGTSRRYVMAILEPTSTGARSCAGRRTVTCPGRGAP